MTTSAYVHIPFCAHRCDYCDFATWTDRHHLVGAYVDACISKIRDHVHEPVDTVFFGGGTPTLIPAEHLARIVEAIPLVSDAEVTIETNPETIDDTSAARLAAAGVTRMSVGMQSGVPRVLEALGRRHDPDSVAAAVTAIRSAGIAHCNVDLIYGAHRETLEEWEASLDAALALPIDHISAYALTIEAGTPLAALVTGGAREVADDDLQADKYLLAESKLSGAGYENYEISNWARAGGVCEHNLAYWTGGTVIPIGCAAHGYDGSRRMWTVRTPDRYIECVQSDTSTIAGEEQLDANGQRRERFMLQLRTRHGAEIPDSDELDEMVGDGFVVPAAQVPGRYVLSTRGKLLANAVTIALLQAWDRAGESEATRPVNS